MSLANMVVNHRVATLTLNRPDVHNALNPELMNKLVDALHALAANPDVRVIVLRGEGKSFCAGADLRWMQESVNYPPEQNYREALLFADLMHAIRLCPKPVIARVHGAAYGGGVGIAAACDLACTLPSAKFCLAEVKLGLIPSIISPFCLERMGMTAYRRYALTAETFDGSEAKRIGLVCDCVPTVEHLDVWVADMTATLLKNSPHALDVCKREVQAVAGTPWDTLRERTARAIADIRVSPEGQEGLRAFLEKRPPAWIG